MERFFNIMGDTNFPLQLAEPKFDPTRTGYNMRDTNFVLEHLAESRGAGFLDTLDLLKVNDRAHTVNKVVDAMSRAPVLITGEVFLYPRERPAGLAMVDTLFPLLWEAQNAGVGTHKIIMPLNFAYRHHEKDNHAMVLLLQYNKDDKLAKPHIFLLEQYALSNRSARDYTRDKYVLQEFLKLHYPAAQVEKNSHPLSSVHRVCGIVSLAVCKRLAAQEGNFSMLRDQTKLIVSADDVTREHAENVALAESEDHSHRRRRHATGATPKPTAKTGDKPPRP